MKLSVRNLQTMIAVVLFALAAGPATRRANADQWSKRSVLRVNQTIQVRDTVLEPGQYVLRLVDSDSDRHIVQIFNGDQSRLVDTIFALPKERMQVTGDTQFTFWETPPGNAKALRAWFYPGDTIGQEFPYPEHPHLLAMVESPAVMSPGPTASAPSRPAAEEPTPAMQPDEAPAPVAEAPTPSAASDATDQALNPPVEEPTSAMEPAEALAPVAETPTPSAAADATDQADSQPEQTKPKELPKTGSRYPLFGVSGAALLALAGLLRVRRPA